MRTVFAVLRQKQQPEAALPVKLGLWFPILALALMLLPILNLDDLPFIIWPAVLVADLLVIAVAVFSGSVLPVLAAFRNAGHLLSTAL